MILSHGLRAAGGVNQPDPYFSSVSLLLHCDGTNGSTTFTDSSNNALTVTANGNAQVNTTTKKYGTGSLFCDGNGDNLSLSSNAVFGFGTGDFTIEMWAYMTDASNTPYLLDCRSTSTAIENVPTFYINTDRTLTYWANGNARVNTTAISLNTWYHLAIVRVSSGNTTTVYANGSSIGSWNADTTNYATTALLVGMRTATAGQSFNGYIDDLRITKGVARYTGAFTPPTAAFPDR